MAILQSMLQKISRKSTAEVVGIVPSANSLANRINALAPIYALQQGRKLVDVVCGRTGVKFQSLILGIDLAQECLQLDELFPFGSRPVHRAGDQFSVQFQRDGEILSFDVALLSISDEASAVYYFSLPQAIDISQRRKQQRIALSKQHPLPVKLLSPRREPWYSTAKNLSEGGMRLVIGGNILDQLRRDMHLQGCEFRFSDEMQLRCEAQVKAFRFNRRPYRQTEVSIEFIGLPLAQRNQLGQLISTYSEMSYAA